METNDYYRFQLEQIWQECPEIAQAAIDELKRTRSSLNMIASENYPSLACQYACSLPLFNSKYCEGFPGHRYYCGCENFDKIENFTNKLAEDLFDAEHAYSQPHSGADANMIAYYAILNKRVVDPFFKEKGVKTADKLSQEDYDELRKRFLSQTLLSLELTSGGHLTHGSRQNLSSKIFNVVHYPLNDEGLIDYDIVREYAHKYKPLILLAGYSAYPRRINFSEMSAIANEVGATLMVDMAHFAGLVAGKVFTGVYDPVRYADIVTTTTHKTLRGPRGGLILCTDEYAPYVDKGCPSVIGGPLENQIAAKAIAFKEAMSDKFKIYSEQVVKNAKALTDEFNEVGAKILTGGTDNHMVILNVTPYGLTGLQAENILKEIGITCNRNTIPNDPNGAWKTSGIRLGTPALTTLGYDEEDMKIIAASINTALKTANEKDANLKNSALDMCKENISYLINKHQVYPSLLKE